MLVPRRFLQLIVVTIACLAIATTTTTLCAQELSQEGQNQKAIHDYLFEKFLEGRETKYQGKGDARALKELTILKETREIRDGDELLLPPVVGNVAKSNPTIVPIQPATNQNDKNMV